MADDSLETPLDPELLRAVPLQAAAGDGESPWVLLWNMGHQQPVTWLTINIWTYHGNNMEMYGNIMEISMGYNHYQDF